MKILVIIALTLWSCDYINARPLYLSGVVPLSGEMLVSEAANGQINITSKGSSRFKLKRIHKRPLASNEKVILMYALEAP